VAQRVNVEASEPARSSSAQLRCVMATARQSRPITDLPVSLADIEDAALRVAGVLRKTPTRRAEALSRALGADVWIKPEHLQRAGSFKIRGAYNRISRLEPGVPVVAASAGNHAQGVALASSLTGRSSTIFMPDNASLPKVQATEDYGAKVVLGGAVLDDCLARAKQHAIDIGGVFVPPFDDPLIVAGQGTLGIELAQELAAVSGARPIVLIPTGGGGLLAGAAIALRAMMPTARIIGVEAAGAAGTVASLKAGTVTPVDVMTMADGIALRAPGLIPFEIISALVDDVVTVTEESISQAVLLLLERAKSVVEPSGAVGIAALVQGVVPTDGPVVAVLSGGNVDPLLLTSIIRHGLSASGRYLRLRVVFRDRPGSLAALTASLAAQGCNVIDVEHHRFGANLSVDEVEVEVTVETRRPDLNAEIVRQLASEGFRAIVI
jgi:threonine dehydratase